MKKLLFILLIAPFCVFAQDMTSYKAANNITYHIGDTVHLGKPSTPDGNFKYFEVGGWNAVVSRGHNMRIDETYSNRAVVIKSIKKGHVTVHEPGRPPMPGNGPEKLWFVVGAGSISNFNLYIDDAISVCEVTPCQAKATGVVNVADELLKLKKLLDSGGITQAEYDAQKKKLLNQ